MSKSTTRQAQTCELAYFWAKIDIGSVPARRFWVYFKNWQVLKCKAYTKTPFNLPCNFHETSM